VSGTLFVVFASAVTLGTTGCSGNATGTVTGKVLFRSKPLMGGNVTFFSTTGKRTVTGAIGEDGSYKLERVPVGPVKICVETESLNPRTKTNVPRYSPPKDQTMPDGYAPPSFEELARRYIQIPDRYSLEDMTPLEYTVVKGEQDKPIEFE